LELKVQDNGKILKPKAKYTLTLDEVKSVCRSINELKMPYDYSSNLARCVDVEKGRIHGIKSHYCHVFMQSLLPIAFSAFHIHVLNPLTKISHFFKDLCSATLKEESLRRMEENFPIILCKLKRIFPLDCLIPWNISLFISPMKHCWVDQCNTNGCIHLKGTKGPPYSYL